MSVDLQRLRDRVEELEEENRQLREALTPRIAFPSEWNLTGQQRAILSALYMSFPNPVPKSDLMVAARTDKPRTILAQLSKIRIRVPFHVYAKRHAGYLIDAKGRALIDGLKNAAECRQ